MGPRRNVQQGLFTRGNLRAVSGGPRLLSAPWGIPRVPQTHAGRVIIKKPYLLNGPMHGVLAYVSE